MDAEESSVEADSTVASCNAKQFPLPNRGSKNIITAFRAQPLEVKSCCTV
jgi:hypothetical protein